MLPVGAQSSSVTSFWCGTGSLKTILLGQRGDKTTSSLSCEAIKVRLSPFLSPFLSLSSLVCLSLFTAVRARVGSGFRLWEQVFPSLISSPISDLVSHYLISSSRR